MSEVYNDIMASLNELMDEAQGKETGIIRHTRTVKEDICRIRSSGMISRKSKRTS